MFRNTLFMISLAACVTSAQAVPEADLFSMTPVFAGARAAGLGGAYEAVADDWTAAWWNPAGLSRLKRVEFSGGLHHMRFENRASLLSDGRVTGRSTRKNPLDHIGLAMPLPTYRGSMVWALGWSRLQDFNLPYAIRDGESTFEVSESGYAGIFSISFAGQLAKIFHGGLSLQVYNGKDDYLWTDSSPLGFEQDYSRYRFDGVGVKFGALINPLRQLRLAATLNSPVKLNQEFEGSEYSFKLPLQLALGASWQERSWLVSASFTHRDWSTAEYNDLSSGTDLLFNRELSRGYGTQTRISMGGEITVPEWPLRLRGGVFARSLAQTGSLLDDADGYYGAFKEETPFRGYSLGAGWLFDEVLALDLAWTSEEGAFSYRSFSALDQPVRIEEEHSRQRITLTLNYRM